MSAETTLATLANLKHLIHRSRRRRHCLIHYSFIFVPIPLSSATPSTPLPQFDHQSFWLEDEISLLIHPFRIIRVDHFNVEIEHHLGKDESCLCEENPER